MPKKEIHIDRTKVLDVVRKAMVVTELVKSGKSDEIHGHGIKLSTPVQNPNRRR